MADRKDHYLAGLKLFGEEKHAEAIAEYQKALELDSRSAEAHLNLGLIAFEREDYEGAADSLERAVAAGSENEFAFYGLGIVYMNYLPNADRAIQNLEAYRDLGGRDERVDDWLRDLAGR